MKELKYIDTPPLKPMYSMKRWIVAQRRSQYRFKAIDNANLEFAYHEVIQKVKTQFMQPGEVYLEKGHKRDNENPFTMHVFITTTLYLRLTCHLDCSFEMTYAFNDCPYEQEIRVLLRNHYFTAHGKEHPLEPSHLAYFDRVRAYNNEKLPTCFKR